MSVPAAFAAIMVIWSTTPLGIVWSNETLSPVVAIWMRMALAAFIGFAVIKLLDIELPWHRKARRTYGYSLVGVYGAMFCTYQAANFVPSGMISVLFALAPVVSNFFSASLIGQKDIHGKRWLSFIIAFSGIALVFLDDWVIQENGWIGIVLMLIAVVLYSISGVMVQREALKAHPLSITVGTLIFSMPLFGLSWFVLDGQLPTLDFASKSLWSVIYLAIFGSLLGFAMYYYVLKRSGATKVAMVALFTPIAALVLGNTLNNEPLTMPMILGSICVISGLALFYRQGKYV